MQQDIGKVADKYLQDREKAMTTLPTDKDDRLEILIDQVGRLTEAQTEFKYEMIDRLDRLIHMGVVWIDADGGLIRLNRIGQFTLLLQGQTQLIANIGIVGLLLEDGTDLDNGVCVIALFN